jgi:RNA polymerase sigma-70 factor, ECF subfamily
MADATEDERLARARGGDPDALSALLVEHTPKLVRMVELRMESTQRRRVEPADVVQDALLEATRRFPEWCTRTSYPFRVWLRLLTAQALARTHRHHLGTQKRDAQREGRLEASRTNVSSARAADWLAASQTSPSQAAGRAEVRALVLGALEQLDELDREILALRHFEQLSNEEAAAELGIEPAAASKRFARALQRMRPALKALQGDVERSG